MLKVMCQTLMVRQLSVLHNAVQKINEKKNLNKKLVGVKL